MNGIFTLVKNDYIKGAILSIIIGLLTYAKQLLESGGKISITAVLSAVIISFIGYLTKQFLTDNNGAVLSMIGGRKKRKKPTLVNNGVFVFDGNDFNLLSTVTAFSDIMIGELVTVENVNNLIESQEVTFVQTIQYNDFETLYFEIEEN